jgi:hypothetical protein
MWTQLERDHLTLERERDRGLDPTKAFVTPLRSARPFVPRQLLRGRSFESKGLYRSTLNPEAQSLFGSELTAVLKTAKTVNCGKRRTRPRAPRVRRARTQSTNSPAE